MFAPVDSEMSEMVKHILAVDASKAHAEFDATWDATRAGSLSAAQAGEWIARLEPEFAYWTSRGLVARLGDERVAKLMAVAPGVGDGLRRQAAASAAREVEAMATAYHAAISLLIQYMAHLEVLDEAAVG